MNEGEEKLSSILIEEEDARGSGAIDAFDQQLERTLKETEQAVLELQKSVSGPDQIMAWSAARDIVTRFKPVPYFIWRLSNYVLGRPGNIGDVSEGLVFGLRRLMFALGSDELLGSGQKVTSVRKALTVVEPDVIAAASVIHAICRRLAAKAHERIWNPILDDALLRARIGFEVGKHNSEFGAGRGMLAGFTGRSGIALLISMGDLEQARQALEYLATGRTISETGQVVYKCDPLQVGAMLLTAAGIGRDAAFGTVSYSRGVNIESLATPEQKTWLAAFQIIENIRMGSIDEVSTTALDFMNIGDEEKTYLVDVAKKAVRRGHGWRWIM
jgi:hypothetical protein